MTMMMATNQTISSCLKIKLVKISTTTGSKIFIAVVGQLSQLKCESHFGCESGLLQIRDTSIVDHWGRAAHQHNAVTGGSKKPGADSIVVNKSSAVLPVSNDKENNSSTMFW